MLPSESLPSALLATTTIAVVRQRTTVGLHNRYYAFRQRTSTSALLTRRKVHIRDYKILHHCLTESIRKRERERAEAWSILFHTQVCHTHREGLVDPENVPGYSRLQAAQRRC